jgi:hypothetical protein
MRLMPSDFVRLPSSETLSACSPNGEHLPAGSVILACEVTPKGRLSDCSTNQDVSSRLKDWGLCVADGVRVQPKLAGKYVEVSLRLTTAE